MSVFTRHVAGATFHGLPWRKPYLDNSPHWLREPLPYPHWQRNSVLCLLIPSTIKQTENRFLYLFQTSARNYNEKPKVVEKLWGTSHRPTMNVVEQPSIGCQSSHLLFQSSCFPFISSAHQAQTSGGLLDPLILHRVSCRTASVHNNPLICDACHFLFISFLPWIFS